MPHAVFQEKFYEKSGKKQHFSSDPAPLWKKERRAVKNPLKRRRFCGILKKTRRQFARAVDKPVEKVENRAGGGKFMNNF